MSLDTLRGQKVGTGQTERLYPVADWPAGEDSQVGGLLGFLDSTDDIQYPATIGKFVVMHQRDT